MNEEKFDVLLDALKNDLRVAEPIITSLKCEMDIDEKLDNIDEILESIKSLIIKPNSTLYIVIPYIIPEILQWLSEMAYRKKRVRFVIVSSIDLKVYGEIIKKMEMLGIKFRLLEEPLNFVYCACNMKDFLLGILDDDLSEINAYLFKFQEGKELCQAIWSKFFEKSSLLRRGRIVTDDIREEPYGGNIGLQIAARFYAINIILIIIIWILVPFCGTDQGFATGIYIFGSLFVCIYLYNMYEVFIGKTDYYFKDFPPYIYNYIIGIGFIFSAVVFYFVSEGEFLFLIILVTILFALTGFLSIIAGTYNFKFISDSKGDGPTLY